MKGLYRAGKSNGTMPAQVITILDEKEKLSQPRRGRPREEEQLIRWGNTQPEEVTSRVRI